MVPLSVGGGRVEPGGRDSALRGFGRRIAVMSNLKALSDLKKIPVVEEAARARSGEKYVTPQGFTAIRDGIKAQGGAFVKTPLTGKPAWLRAKAPSGVGFQGVKAIVKEHRLATVSGDRKSTRLNSSHRR